MSRWFHYPAHGRFVEPARQYRQVSRIVIGVLLAGFIYVTLNQIFFTLIYMIYPSQSAAFYQDLLRGATPMAMYALLGSFGFMSIGIAVVVRALHNRPFRSVFGPFSTALAQFAVVARALFILSVVAFLLPPWGGEGQPALEANMALGQWMTLLPFSLLAVLIQTSAEEVVFRGYLQQQLAARFRSPWVWMVVPSLCFGLLHYSTDTAGENAGIITLWAIVFGFLMADLTARAGTLGPAIAVHFMTNVSALLVTSVPDNLFGLALYVIPFSMSDVELMRAQMPAEFLMLLIFWLAARVAIRR